MRFAIFPLHLSKVLRLPRKIEDRSYEVLHLSRKIILANLQIWCSKMQRLSGNQRPDLLTSLMNMSFVLCLPREMHLWRSSSNVPCLPSFLEMLQKTPRFAHFWQGAQSFAPATRKHIWTSKSAPYRSVFYTFDFEMCFAPQRRALFRHLNFQKWSEPLLFLCFAPQWRALFRHLNFQKWSEHGVFCSFWLRNVLRHNGVQFFISHLASWLRTRRFSEPTFRPSGATNHWNILEKHSVSRLSYLFAHLPLLSSNSFSSLIFSLLLFSSLWLCPSLLFICPFCRKFDL